MPAFKVEFEPLNPTAPSDPQNLTIYGSVLLNELLFETQWVKQNLINHNIKVTIKEV